MWAPRPVFGNPLGVRVCVCGARLVHAWHSRPLPVVDALSR